MYSFHWPRNKSIHKGKHRRCFCLPTQPDAARHKQNISTRLRGPSMQWKEDFNGRETTTKALEAAAAAATEHEKYNNGNKYERQTT